MFFISEAAGQHIGLVLVSKSQLSTDLKLLNDRTLRYVVVYMDSLVGFNVQELVKGNSCHVNDKGTNVGESVPVSVPLQQSKSVLVADSDSEGDCLSVVVVSLPVSPS